MLYWVTPLFTASMVALVKSWMAISTCSRVATGCGVVGASGVRRIRGGAGDLGFGGTCGVLASGVGRMRGGGWHPGLRHMRGNCLVYSGRCSRLTCSDIFARDSEMRMMASSCLTVTGTGGESLSSRVAELRACERRGGGREGGEQQVGVRADGGAMSEGGREGSMAAMAGVSPRGRSHSLGPFAHHTEIHTALPMHAHTNEGTSTPLVVCPPAHPPRRGSRRRRLRACPAPGR